MNRQLTTFLGFMAGWIGRRQQLVIDYLLEENRVLKEQFDATGKKLRLTNAQRRNLAIKGRKLRWTQLMQYANLVKPETLYAWHRRFVQLKYTAKTKVKTAGQSRMAAIRELCLKFAVENTGWGYGRIQGALSNIGYTISRTTVGNILRAAGIEPSPDRGKESNWKRFIRTHLSVISVADFLTTEVWTLRGLVRYHTFFVMNLARREVHIAHIDCQVNGQVMAQVARNLTDAEDGFLKGMEYFICDHDALYTHQFRNTLKSAGVDVIQTSVGYPEQNGYAESFVSSIKRECLDRLIFFGEKSLRKAVSEFVKHYHGERNHQGLNNQIPFPQAPRTKGCDGLIVKSERLGGLLNYYHRVPDPDEPPENREEVPEAA
ncbi:transposase [Ruficoccus amylovorans]|uniref:Transposase n=1 Tax=Ruficoccus amylovorans TaxID=1804625 RepID=A0A842HDX5_9BACT|nr:integrase core domain-containing protein [Ruficoccus amylovorans]MBC2593876.1 transposase [Ruficoccus amylovorans]